VSCHMPKRDILVSQQKSWEKRGCPLQNGTYGHLGYLAFVLSITVYGNGIKSQTAGTQIHRFKVQTHLTMVNLWPCTWRETELFGVAPLLESGNLSMQC
jgi:hypothetical protein